MKELFSLLFGIGVPCLAMFIFWLICYFEEDNVRLRKIGKQRIEWYKKYPVGTNIEIVTWEKKKPKTQTEANAQLDWRMMCVEKATAMYFRDDYGDLKVYDSPIVKEKKKQDLERVFTYYTVVSPQEYYKAQKIKGAKHKLEYVMNDNGILLYCRGERGEFRSITKETEGELNQGIKEIYKVSDVKMKILDLKGRESKNEIVKSYSNSRKKNYRKGVQSK